MSREYVMQLEATIANLERDKQTIKDELFKYRDLEKELGCPLDVYVNATINGIIVGGEWFPIKIHKDTNGYYFALSNGSAFPFYLSSYKKTWWLKENWSE